MGRWSYAYLDPGSGGGPHLRTTEPAVLDEVFDALKKEIPSARMSTDAKFEKMGVRHALFHRLEGANDVVVTVQEG
jgi:hypothetical protein